MRRKLLHVVFGFILGATVSPAQMRALNGTGVADTTLQDHHIALTKDALLAALRHPAPNVRSAAALVLATRGEKDAIPAILAALTVTTFPGARIGLAYAATELGTEDGFAALRSMCGDSSWSAVLRVSAAYTMLLGGREDCLSSVLDVVRFHDDDQATADALILLPQFKHVSAEEMREVRNLVRMSLKSDSGWVKREASYVLRQWGDSSAVEDLRSALAGERDETTRKVMATDLKAIEEKQANPPDERK